MESVTQEEQEVKPLEEQSENAPSQANDDTAIKYAKYVLGISENKLQLTVGEPDPQWKDYGLYSVPMLITGEEGKFIRSGRKFILRAKIDGNGVVQPPRLVADLGEDYELYPNEKLQEDIDKWAAQNGYERIRTLGMRTRSEDVFFASYVPSEGLYKHSGGQVVNEEAWRFAHSQQIKLGFSVRNSVNGTVGFGIDAFTFRMACENGSIIHANLLKHIVTDFTPLTSAGRWKNSDHIGKLTARHVKSIRAVIANLSQYLDQLVETYQGILRYYSQLQTMTLNKQLIDTLLTRIPQKYLTTPSSEKSETICEIPKKTKQNENPEISFNASKTLWDSYNVLTDNIWHDPKPDMKTKEFYYEKMHEAFLSTAPVIQVA